VFFWPGLRPPADTLKSWNIQMLERTAPSADDKIARLAAIAHGASNENDLVTIVVVVSVIVLEGMMREAGGCHRNNYKYTITRHVLWPLFWPRRVSHSQNN